jgi:hypothetical protein
LDESSWNRLHKPKIEFVEEEEEKVMTSPAILCGNNLGHKIKGYQKDKGNIAYSRKCRRRRRTYVQQQKKKKKTKVSALDTSTMRRFANLATGVSHQAKLIPQKQFGS